MKTFELTTTQSTVCKLISAAMFHTHETFAADVDWNAVLEEMRAQTVQGLVLDILPELPLPDDLRKVWRAECFQIIRDGMKLRFEQGEFLSILEEAKIPYVILKGTAASMYYPNPLLRGMGDVDVYVPVHYHEKVKKILKKNDYVMDDETTKYKSRYIRHIAFRKNEIEFEVHCAYATINGDKEKHYVDGLLDDCCKDSSKVLRIEQNGGLLSVPSTNVNGIVLLEHIGHHMLGGLGFRQIVDWMMFVKSSLRDTEWDDFRIMAHKSGLEKLAVTVTKMCVNYFGLSGAYDWCMDADEKDVDNLLRYLFESGNFGRKLEDANKAVSAASRLKRSKNYFVTLQSIGENHWKLCEKYRWLRPFAWIYQIFYYVGQVLRSPESVKNVFRGSAAVEKRSSLMKSLGIYMKIQ